jgi:hypothetical protein
MLPHDNDFLPRQTVYHYFTLLITRRYPADSALYV